MDAQAVLYRGLKAAVADVTAALSAISVLINAAFIGLLVTFEVSSDVSQGVKILRHLGTTGHVEWVGQLLVEAALLVFKLGDHLVSFDVKSLRR